MKGPVSAAALSVLVLCCCCCSLARGDHDAGPGTTSLSISPLETTSTPHHFSTAEPNVLTNSTAQHLNISEVDSSTTEELSANGTLIQNNTTNSTEAPASAATAAATAADQLTAGDNTSVPGNHTESQEGSDLSAGDNHPLSTTTAPITTTLPTTLLPRTEPQTSTSAPTTILQTSLASATSPHSTTVDNKSATTNSETTTAQTRQNSSTARNKSTAAPTTTEAPTTEASRPHNSTPVQAKARADTPSELNVGDEDSSATWDPLLAGLVSVFVVTAAIVSLLIFLKFRHRNERPEFRRLQDLPMDDMMEDTPLSMYSY
ncbi:uncharacterized protein LOC103033886 [Astyanax mexicanus]|uniref:uncharacterized protein LOC103033886 n=1 Tax=Astyanax mexicanus TaxID=7994 RepID=UPI0020CAFFB4|nr:uncharacterized protein LOC103033886 [Astyanax mexicanus]